MSSKKSPVVLFGYNRVENVRKRLLEIISWNPPHIYVSIDGPKKQSDRKIFLEILKYLSKYNSAENITIYSHENNLGLSNHITTTITKILSIEETLIIVEDDIEMFKNTYMSMSRILNDSNITGFAIVGGFSSIPSPPNFLKRFLPNKFRVATYTSLWGWGIRKDKWNLFELNISKINLDFELYKSELWDKLSLRQKKIWLARFKKVANDPNKTWDFQVQFMCFRNNLPTLSPIFRALDNVGFADNRSTNTKGKKPRYYFGKTDYRFIDGIIWGGLVPRITDFADGFSDLIPHLKKIIKFKIR